MFAPCVLRCFGLLDRVTALGQHEDRRAAGLPDLVTPIVRARCDMDKHGLQFHFPIFIFLESCCRDASQRRAAMRGELREERMTSVSVSAMRHGRTPERYQFFFSILF